MTELTPKERLLRTIRHQEPDRVPISPRYWDYLLGAQGCECEHHAVWMSEQYEHELMVPYKPPQNNYLLHHFGPYNDLPGVRVSIETDIEGEALIVRRRFDTPAGTLTDVRSVVLPGSTITFDHVIEAPVKDRADLEKVKFLLPDPDNVYVGDIPLLRKFIGDRGLLMPQATQGVDQLVMDSLGVQNALLTYYDDRDLLFNLLHLYNNYHRSILKRILETGVEIVFEPWYNFSESTGWSPTQFRALVIPMLKSNVELIHSYGALVDYYDDGKMNHVLEDLAGAGVDVAETLGAPPMGNIDLASAKQRIGDKVCLKGHIDQVNLICFGKPADIREAVRKAMEVGKPGGGFIIGTSDSIRPESPPENIRAYFDACLEFGRY